MKIVIRAGGSGTRLWPVSRRKNPKQFQAIINDKSLIQNTIDRVKPLLKNKSDFFISINQEVAGKLKKEIPGLASKNIIIEPAGRNTGPAICLESCILARRFGEEAIVASLPSDDYISDAAAFCAMLRAAEKFSQKNPDYIITPGAKPTLPDEGYSYIKIGKKLAGGGGTEIFKVADWVEKPAINRCKKIIRSGKYFAHAGMYIWKLKTILDLFRKLEPEMYAVCKRLAAGERTEKYAKFPKISIEMAITNHAPKIAVAVSRKIGWSDLGKWQILAKMLRRDMKGNVKKGKIISLDTKNCLLYGPEKKLIATLGLSDLVVILTDDALLVCPKDRAGEVKKIVEELEKRELGKYL